MLRPTRRFLTACATWPLQLPENDQFVPRAVDCRHSLTERGMVEC